MSTHLIDLVVGELVTIGNVLAAHGVVHVGLDAPGRNAVDSDLLVAAVNGHAADKGLDGTFGPGVDGVLGNTLRLTGDGAHQDDAAADAHVFVRLTSDEELAASVDAEHTVKLFLRHIFQMAEADDARVGADNVELTVVLDRLIHELGGLRNITDVGLDGDGVTPILLDVVDDLVGGVGGMGVIDDHLSATAGELGGHGRTDAAAGARDEGYLAVQAGGLNCLGGHCICLCLRIVADRVAADENLLLNAELWL